MANVNPKQDGNQNTGLFGISGTLGATFGTSETRPITVTEDGKMNVNVSAGITVGTIDEVTNIAAGTITRIGTIDTIGTMPAISLAINSSTVTTIIAGTQNTLGTVGAVNSIVAGTQNTLGTVGVVNNIVTGTIDKVSTIDTITNTIALADVLPTGDTSVLGDNAFPVSFTVQDAPTVTWSTATYGNALINTKGELFVKQTDSINVGSINSIGTMPAISMGDISGGTIDLITDGTVQVKGGTVSNLVSGTINSATAVVGTIPGIGVVTNLTSGSVTLTSGTLTVGTLTNLVSGTINSATAVVGTIPGVGTISNVGLVTPGTASTNLGKGHSDAAGATDVGVAVFGVRRATDVHDDTDAVDGDYARLAVTDFRELKTRDQRAIDLANCNTGTADYTALSDDTINIGVSSNHVFGTAAITFDKANGTANTIYGGVSKSLGTVNVAEIFEAGGFVGCSVYLPSLTNVVGVFLRIGTDSTNYNCWFWPVASLTAATWLNLRQPASTPDYGRNAGTGWNPSALKYVAFGVEFNAEANTLANILFDHVHIVGGRVTATDLSTAVTTTVNNPNINIQKVGNNIVSTNNGTTDAGVLRVTISSDSTGKINVGTITTIPNTPGGTLGVVSALTTGSVTLTSGTLTVGTLTNLVSGTINSATAVVGTIPGIGVVTNLTSGSVVLTSGTLTVGTLTNLVSGTINSATAVVGTIPGIGVVTNLTSGSVRMTVGTLTEGTLTNLVSGTINSATAVVGTVPGIGTVTSMGTLYALLHGTVDAGTVQVNPKSPTTVLTASALGTAGGSLFGTLSAASGAGTAHYVTGLQIVQMSGTTDTYVGFGTALTGGSVLARGNFAPGGGIMRDFSIPIASGTNSEICYELAGAGTVFVAVNYWKGT